MVASKEKRCSTTRSRDQAPIDRIVFIMNVIVGIAAFVAVLIIIITCHRKHNMRDDASGYHQLATFLYAQFSHPQACCAPHPATRTRGTRSRSSFVSIASFKCAPCSQTTRQRVWRPLSCLHARRKMALSACKAEVDSFQLLPTINCLSMDAPMTSKR